MPVLSVQQNKGENMKTWRHQKADQDGVQYFRMEGNNGADYIEIIQVSETEIELSVGHCCVNTFSHKVPIEFLTNVLTELGLELAPIISDNQAVAIMERYCKYTDRDSKDKLIAKIV